MIQLNLWDKTLKTKWNLLVVYGDAQEEGKIPFLNELANFCHSNQEPILIGGDFNIIRFSHEKNNSNRLHTQTNVFNSLINFFELKELEMSGGVYTWSNNQNPPTLEKLDRILVSNSWEDLFPTAIVTKLPREVSDHNPLILSCGQQKKANPIQFRFETSWLHNADFFDEVKRIWDRPCGAKTPIDRIQQKLKLFKKYFKGWGFNLQGELRKKRKKIQDELILLEELEEKDALNYDQGRRKTELLLDNMNLLLQEEVYWFNRSHEKWLKMGDINTGYFHKCASGGRRKTTIVTLETDDITIEGQENLLNHATEYYRHLFGPEPENDFKLDPSIWDECSYISKEDNDILCHPFSEAEIKAALFQMERNKAPGPDKIPIEFFQYCWDIVKCDILDLFRDFHAGNADISRINYGIITLLPKIKDASRIQ